MGQAIAINAGGGSSEVLARTYYARNHSVSVSATSSANSAALKSLIENVDDIDTAIAEIG